MQSHFSGLKRRSKAASAGFTLLENVVACAIIAVGLAGTYLVNGQCMGVLRMAKDEAAGSQVLQQRVENLRIANWQRISSPTWIRDNILNAPADGASTLSNLTEKVSITPYKGTLTTTNTFTRTSGTAAAGPSNASLVTENAVQVTWNVSWTGVPKGKTHTRELVVVLGKGGIAK
jgi:Tfp pilus assembly protein PilV